MGLSQSQLVTVRPYLEVAIQSINDLCNRLDHNGEAERSLQEFCAAFFEQWNRWNDYERWELDRWENEGGATSDAPPIGFCAVDLPDRETPFNAVWHPWRKSAEVAANWLEQVGLNDECIGVRVELGKLPTPLLTPGFRDDLRKLDVPIRAAAEQVRKILAAVLTQPWAEVRADLEAAAPPVAPVPAESTGKPNVRTIATKRSTAKGDAEAKIIGALTAHHGYSNGGCSNFAPIGVNELARKAEVGAASVNRFFDKQFNGGKKEGHKQYGRLCHSQSGLVTAIKLLNGEFSPYLLLNNGAAATVVSDDE